MSFKQVKLQDFKDDLMDINIETHTEEPEEPTLIINEERKKTTTSKTSLEICLQNKQYR